MTIVALGAAWFGGKLILRQVDALVAATGRLAAGDLGARVPLCGSRSELALLAEAFNEMAATLQARDRELRAAEERTRAAEIEVAVTRAQLEIAQPNPAGAAAGQAAHAAGVRFAGRCIPAVEVGGDYFGYLSARRRLASTASSATCRGTASARRC